MTTTAREEQKETGRLEAFSDGVFAIAITLLILEIKLPTPEIVEKSGGLARAIMDQWPFLMAYVISFLTILVMWINHHAMFDAIRRIDRPFLLFNGLLLMVITFVNYPTAVLAEYLYENGWNQTFATLLYNGVFVVIAILYNVLWLYASHRYRLIGKNTDPNYVRRITVQYRFGPLMYLIVALLALVNVYASLVASLVLAVYFVFTGINHNLETAKAKKTAPQEVQKEA